MLDLLSLKAVSKKYGIKQALNNINLNIPSGKIVGLFGPKGGGRTTLMKIITGVLNQTEGVVSIDGVEPNEITKSYVAYLPDKIFLDESMTIKDTISMHADFYEDFSKDRAYEMFNDLKIPDKFKIKDLSKENRRKLQVILVMSRNAKLYVLDEPFINVDNDARDYILKIILSNYNRNSTVLISTILTPEVERIIDEVVFIKDGEIILYDAADKIRNEKGCSIDEYFREVFNVS